MRFILLSIWVALFTSLALYMAYLEGTFLRTVFSLLVAFSIIAVGTCVAAHFLYHD